MYINHRREGEDIYEHACGPHDIISSWFERTSCHSVSRSGVGAGSSLEKIYGPWRRVVAFGGRDVMAM